MTNKQHNDDPIALRKQLIEMRLELNRQKIRHESMALLEPVQKLRGYQKRLTQGSTPLLIVAGATFASFFLTRNRRSAGKMLPLLKVAAGLLPFLLVKSQSEADTTSSQADNLDKTH